MQLDWLHTFLDISETKNFNRSAERLQITQSTVSTRIRSLEKELDTHLFVRGRAGATLTSEGAKLLSYANNIRINWNLALKELKGPKDYRGNIQIATQISIREELVNNWLTKIRKVFPKTAINLQADYSVTMVKELLLGNLDIAILYAPEYRPNFEIQHLFDEKFVMVSTEPFHIQQVNQENYIFVHLTDYFKEKHSALLPHLQAAGISMSLSMMSLEYLKKHGGAAYISKNIANDMLNKKELYIVEDSPVIEQPVFTAYLSKYRNSIIITKILEILRESQIKEPPLE